MKADIVAKFVIAWAKVFLTSKTGRPLATQAAYIDFFSGPGTYDDGKESTPLLIARKVIDVKPLSDGLRMFFNDATPALVQSLEQEMKGLPGYSKLRYPPQFSNEEASIELIENLHLSSEVPQFFFLDQFGYSDVKPNMIKRIFQARRCDCAFFFRTSRVLAAVTNKSAEPAMLNLFGRARLDVLRTGFRTIPCDKEALVLNALKEVARESGAPYFQAFPFWIRHTGSSKHHLIYLGKHERGLGIMKDIMSKSSSSDESGVPVIGFAEGAWTPSLFESDPIDDLVRELLQTFDQTRLKVGEIFTRHHPSNSRFLLKHYQEAIRRMEADEQVRCEPPESERPKRNGRVTMSETVTVSFQRKES